MIYFTCTRQEFVPVENSGVRWLEPDRDYELARTFWAAYQSDLSYERWAKAHEFGYQYAAVVEDGKIISCAGVWRFSDDAWDVAAVSTLTNFRRRGYSKRVVAFIAAYILEAGRVATCSTGDINIAMIATAKSVGFKEIAPDKVWWTYPRLPEF